MIILKGNIVLILLKDIKNIFSIKKALKLFLFFRFYLIYFTIFFLILFYKKSIIGRGNYIK